VSTHVALSKMEYFRILPRGVLWLLFGCFFKLF